jgi:hypothetical protein
MSNETFDVAIGLRRDAMDRAVAKLYGQLYPKYFKGDADAGSGRRVYYDVKSAPKLDFSGTTGLAEKDLEELQKLAPAANAPARKPLLQAPPPLSLEARAAAIDARTVKVRFDSIDITIRSPKGEAKTTASAMVWLAFEIEYPAGQPPRGVFVVKNAKATTPNPDDQFILNAVVIPVVKKLAAQVLSAIQIPSILAIAGVRFDLPEPRIIGEYFVILAKKLSRHFQLGFDANVPGGNPEAFLLLSPEMMQEVMDNATRDMKFDKREQGKEETPVLNVYYDAIVSASGIKGVAQGIQFPVTASVSGIAHVWANPFWGTEEVWCSATPTSTPRGNIALRLESNNRIRASISSVDPFRFKVTVTGGSPVGWILELFEPIIEREINSLVPLIENYLRGLSFDVCTVPDLSFSFEGISFNVRPTNLSLTAQGKHLQLTGSVQV